jgi:hypothetical protein
MSGNDCPNCLRKKAMRPGKDLTGRNWPGSLCRFCTHFIPDVVSDHYGISCEDCGKPSGGRSFDRFWHDLDEEKVQELLQAESSRAAAAKLQLDRLIERRKIEPDQKLVGVLDQEIAKRKAEGLHVPRDFKLRPSWQKRHEELRGKHFCSDCHQKRRKNGVNFEDISSYAAHELKCSVCKKVVGHLYIAEHHGAEIHEEKIRTSGMDCTGDCSEQAAKISSEIRKTLK